MNKNTNFLGPTNGHPPFGLCLRPDNDINEALSPWMHVNYSDDSYLQGDYYCSCLGNVLDTIRLLYYLGFLIQLEKSVLVPTQRLTFLGFILDSVLMRIYMNSEKIAKVFDLCSNLLRTQSPTIRFHSSLAT